MSFSMSRFRHRLWHLLLHPASLAAFLVGAYAFWEDGFPVKTDGRYGSDAIIGICLAYLFAFVLSGFIGKLTSTTTFVSDSTLRQEIVECANQAQDWLILVSPYLDPGNVIVEAVIKAVGRGVRVSMYTHTKQIHDPTARAALGRLGAKGVRLFYHPNLHAKICINESQAVVSSLNLVAGSFIDSFEAGISTDNRGIRGEVREYIEKTIARSDLISKLEELDLAPPNGFCIKTGVKMQFEPRRPVEYSEYKRSLGNSDGKFCHACGCTAQTTIGRPFCAEHEAVFS